MNVSWFWDLAAFALKCFGVKDSTCRVEVRNVLSTVRVGFKDSVDAKKVQCQLMHLCLCVVLCRCVCVVLELSCIVR